MGPLTCKAQVGPYAEPQDGSFESPILYLQRPYFLGKFFGERFGFPDLFVLHHDPDDGFGAGGPHDDAASALQGGFGFLAKRLDFIAIR